MILRRLGNKKKLAEKIISLFPAHDIYFEPFFGTGSIFFKKPIVKYNYLNDLDNNVSNLWEVVKYRKKELIKEIKMLPIHRDIWIKYRNYDADNQIDKALFFLYYSNFGFLGKNMTIKYSTVNSKKILLKNISKTFDKIENVFFNNKDFRLFFKDFSFKNESEKNRTFCYADPPYQNTGNNYNTTKFGLNDFTDLLDLLINLKIKFAVSEFNSEVVIAEALKRGLIINEITVRRNLNSQKKSTEILITNYKAQNKLF